MYCPPGVPEISGKLHGFPTHFGMPNTELAPPDQSPYQHRSLEGPFGDIHNQHRPLWGDPEVMFSTLITFISNIC